MEPLRGTGEITEDRKKGEAGGMSLLAALVASKAVGTCLL